MLIFIISACSAATRASAPGQVTIMAPASYASTQSDQIYVVGRTNAPLVEVFVNDVKFCDGRVVDSVFHVRVRFAYGLNVVKVTPVYSGVEETASASSTVEVLCGPFDPGRLERIYPPYDFHGSGAANSCTGCHKESSLEPFAAADTSGCLECHTEYALQEGERLVAGHKDCGVCHSLDSGHSFLADATAGRCFSCHSDKIESFNQEFIHGPVAGGSCIVCHEPHRSKYEHSLRSEEEMLCFSCHEFNGGMKQYSVQHPPFRDGQCATCHDPHATSNRWVLVKSSEAVCLECHDPNQAPFSNHSHPYNVKPKNRSTRQLSLSSDGRLECLTCHLPHAGRTAHLLRSSERNTCLGCHSEM